MNKSKSAIKLPSKAKAFTLRLGELLIKEGFISSQDLQKALELQQKDSQEAALPLGTLMVKKKMLTEEQLKILTHHPDLRKSIGTMLVEKGVISQDQLKTCLRLKKTNEFLGQVLMRHRLIDQTQLEKHLQNQTEGVKIGELAHHLRMINEEELDQVLRIKSGHRTIGEVLCDMGLITTDDLGYILQKYGKQLKLGEILIKQEILTEDQYQKALQEQSQTREKFGRILVKHKYITQDQLYHALSRQFNLPYRTLEGFEFDSRQRRTLSGIVGKKYAHKHRLLPLALSDNTLQVGIADPESKKILVDLNALYPDLKIDTVLISREKYNELFKALYEPSAAERAHKNSSSIQDMELVEIDLKAEPDAQSQVNVSGGTDMMAEQVVDFIIRYGISNSASDIHLEQDRQGVRLRYRMDGICKEVDIDWLNAKLQEMPNAIISRIKVMANLDIAERRLPQDGVFRVNYFDRTQDRRFDLDFRVATCPAIVSENVTIRILDSRKAQVGLENLNHSPHVLGPLKRLFKSAAGIILVTGPTGSGKSSTLYAALRYIYHPGIKIITAEDPIEYNFPGIMQTQVKPKINLNFARLLRSFLRLDPDVILVGEIRDDETASISFDAAQTGHLMLSTLHTNDSISAVSRLLDLNIDYNQIASSLIGVLAQRLVRKICDKCKTPYQPLKEEWSLFFKTYPEHLTFYKGMGCKSCGYSGYEGRTLISELFEINREIALALSKGASENKLKRIALKNNMKTMIDDGLLKLDQTTLAELIRMVPIEMIREFTSRQKKIKGVPQNGLNGLPPTFCERVSMQLSDPIEEQILIDHLFERYQELQQAVGQRQSSTNADHFRRFITDAYEQVIRQHQCNKVEYALIAKDQHVEINAIPIKETP